VRPTGSDAPKPTEDKVAAVPAARAEMRGPLIAAVAALSLLGLLGACLVLAHGGFETSGKRGGWHVFVPPPQSYIMVALMLAQSGLALAWLVQQTHWRRGAQVAVAAGWLAAVWGLTALLRWWLA
jgi:hypothetical protein